MRQPDGNMGIVAQAHVLNNTEFGETNGTPAVANDLRAFVIDHHAITMDFKTVLGVEAEAGEQLTTSINDKLLDTPSTIRSMAKLYAANECPLQDVS